MVCGCHESHADEVRQVENQEIWETEGVPLLTVLINVYKNITPEGGAKTQWFTEHIKKDITVYRVTENTLKQFGEEWK